MKYKTYTLLPVIITLLSGCQKESIQINNLNKKIELAKSGGGSAVNITLGLVAYLPFNGNAKDATGNNYNGTIVGAKLTNDRAGRKNSAYYFDGVSNYISIPSIDFSGSDKMSLSCWVKAADFPAGSQIFRQEGIGTAPDILLAYQQQNGDLIAFGLSTSQSIDYPYTELRILFDRNNFLNKWHHIVAVYDGINKYIYIDGIKLGTEARTGNIFFKSSIASIGNRFTANNEYFYGSLDDFRFYNRVLTKDEITYLTNL